MKIRKRQMTSKLGRAYVYYVVDLGTIDGKRDRRNFPTREEAQRWAREFKRSKAKYGDASVKLSAPQHIIAIEAFSRLESAGLSDDALLLAVNAHLDKIGAISESISLSDALNRYINTFSVAQNQHRRCIRATVGKFVQFVGEEKPADEVLESDVDNFLGDIVKRGLSEKTYNTNLTYTRTFFNWCAENKYIADNPVVAKVKRIAYKDPEFIKVHRLEQALHTLEATSDITDVQRETLINFFTLSFFCGIRTSEIMRLTPEAIHPEDEHPFVRISTTKGATKGVKGRIVDLEKNAAAWLKAHPFRRQISAKMLNKARTIAFNGCLKEFIGDFVHNVGRHSYITYHSAKYRDYSKTEAFVGTSSAMRVKHYQGLATTKDANAYFDIFPKFQVNL